MRSCAVIASLVLVASGAGCDGDEVDSVNDTAAAEREATRLAAAAADSAEQALAPVELLGSGERSDLRRDLNPVHVASARAHGIAGIEDSAQVRRFVTTGALVPLQDGTDYWIVRELEHSLPYITPDARAMLLEIGRRFQARLDSLGIPPYRFEVTSVLRTAELQAALRGQNSNASQSTSSHEFGTTVDIAYTEFAPPAAPVESAPLTAGLDSQPDVARLLEPRMRRALDRVAEDRSAELEAILGRVLNEMQDEGQLHALRERSQAVYHVTVSTQY